MTNLEIKDAIDNNNRLIQEALDPTEFVLNETIRDLMKANLELQKQCTHEVENGVCKYCYLRFID